MFSEKTPLTSFSLCPLSSLYTSRNFNFCTIPSLLFVYDSHPLSSFYMISLFLSLSKILLHFLSILTPLSPCFLFYHLFLYASSPLFLFFFLFPRFSKLPPLVLLFPINLFLPFFLEHLLSSLLSMLSLFPFLSSPFYSAILCLLNYPYYVIFLLAFSFTIYFFLALSLLL
uniref:NADH dehydrogenase subunit 6 n=1 Tax=Engystomops pustulosus TaxID=76066 RepID=A0AAV6YLV2_ENGPU|nr:hypothetical protein GDO81_025147 [Engystomops pustulosus]